MIVNMADGDEREDIFDESEDQPQNIEMNHGNNGMNNRSVEDTLQALLAASLTSNDAEDLNDMDSIAGGRQPPAREGRFFEFSTLHNTIDELNSFLDRWDERHDRLRAQIREALEEDERERNDETSEVEPSEESTEARSNAADKTKSTSHQGSNSVSKKENSEHLESSTNSEPPPRPS